MMVRESGLDMEIDDVPEVIERERRNPEGAKVVTAERIPPDRPVTFRDFIPTTRYGKPHKIKDFTNEEVEALPVSGNFGPPDGWEKTGYLQAQKLFGVSGGNENVVYYEYVEFLRSIPGGSYETEHSLVYVKGAPLIGYREPYE